MFEELSLGDVERLDDQRLTEKEIVLSVRDARSFQNSPITARINGSTIELSSGTETESFESLQAKRKAARTEQILPDDMLEKLHSAEGMELTNVGISLELQLTIGDRTFLPVVYQDRKDMGDKVFKLISGYVDVEPCDGDFGRALSATMLDELREELLILRDGELLPIKLSLETLLDPLTETDFMHLIEDDGESLKVRSRYDRTFAPLDNEEAAILTERPTWSYIPSTSVREIKVDGHELRASMYFDQNFQCAQIVYTLAMDIPEGAKVTLMHAEEKPDPESGPLFLKTVLDPDGIILLEVNKDGTLSGENFWLKEGQLVPAFPKEEVTLSEAFVDQEVDYVGYGTGIVASRNIPLSKRC